jgi:hypothetical protein
MESKPRNTWFFVRRLKGILYDVLSNEMCSSSGETRATSSTAGTQVIVRGMQNVK